MIQGTVALVLGGGRGTRLLPLTKYRSKPAVPLAGKYRLIDIPLSNCINSGMKQIYVLTQFLSVSLHRHIRGTYRFGNFENGFVELLAAQQTMAGGTDWYEGTADAVRKNLRYLKQPGIEHVVILSGDQLYRMNYQDMLTTHREAGADVTIATKPVHRHEASGLGIMRADESGRVVGFLEKPQTDEEVEMVAMDPGWIDGRGIASEGRACLASMGIYVFNRDMLVSALETTDYHDFGKEIFPAVIRSKKVHVHLFDGYWEDIGTIQSFFEANLNLALPEPSFELTSATAPIYSRPRFLPPTRLDGATVNQSLVADGCLIQPGAKIENSVVGLRCCLDAGITIRNSVLMGADEYELPHTETDRHREGMPPIGIGANSFIDGAIVDKNCRIGAGVNITNQYGTQDRDIDDGITVRDGIVVVQKGAVVPDGWSIEGK